MEMSQANAELEPYNQLAAMPTRRNSNASDSAKLTYAISTYDSGNYSSSSNASECGVAGHLEFEPGHSCVRFQQALREKEQALFLALQDVRKLRSELERLSKSEQWYKQELRLQKNTRLEALERLYAQERKYMQENQRLQRECVRLYEKCGDMEEELETQRGKALCELTAEVHGGQEDAEHNSKDFEIEQQQALVVDQQQLILVLRKQKRALLEDLKRLTEEKDEKVLTLQQTLAGMEVENTRMTSKCKQLISERKDLEETLKVQVTDLERENVEKLKLQQTIADLREQLRSQEELLLQKEAEVLDLQSQFKTRLKDETNMDEVHRLSMSYHLEINAKISEIAMLKSSLLALQEELVSLADLQTQNEQQERLIENLNFNIGTRQFEVENLRQTDAEKTRQISELQGNLARFQSERETALEQLHATQTQLKSGGRDLIILNEKYAHMSSLCERTRFELELREIQYSKLQFQSESDQREITQLRDKLRECLQQVTQLSRKINELEKELDVKAVEMSAIERSLANVEEQLRFQNVRFENEDCIRKEEQPDLQMSVPKNEGKPFQPSTANKLKNEADEQQSGISKLSIEMGLSGQRGNALQEISPVEENAAALNQLRGQNEILGQELRIARAAKTELEEELCKEKATSDLLRNNLDKLASYEEVGHHNLNNTSKDELGEDLLESLRNQPEEVQLSHGNSPGTMQIRRIVREQSVADGGTETTDSQPNLLSCEVTTQTLPNSLQGIDSTELPALRASVRELEEKLSSSLNVNEEKREQRLKLIKKLLDQQDDRVRQLNETQAEWEELLSALTAAQQLEEHTRSELQLKRAELEELNELFAEQNEELRKLQEFALHTECRRQEECEQLRETFQEQLNVMQDAISVKGRESDEQRRIIEELQVKNSRLQMDLGEDYAYEVTEHRKQLRGLQAKVENLSAERDEYAHKVRELKQEMSEWRRNKRAAMVLPELVVFRESSSETDREGEANAAVYTDSSSAEDPAQSTDDRLRILTKVLESECRRKMRRYDLHIRTLLANVKSLKKALKAAEQKSAALSAEHNQSAEELQDLQMTRRRLEEMRLKFDQSQAVIKALEQTLDQERKKFEGSDLSKASHQEQSNLIDDYKKLIQQSAAATRRPKMSVILELMQRSNECVPNLNQLDATVEELRKDIQQFIVSYASGPFAVGAIRVPSLMDELRAAAENF